MDDEAYRFNGKDHKNCEWVGRETLSRCRKKDWNGDKVKHKCRLTCSFCRPNPGSAPIPAPTSAPVPPLKKDNGVSCTSGGQCKSGQCSFAIYENKNICMPEQKKDIGQQCNENYECITGECSYDYQCIGSQCNFGKFCAQNSMCNSLDGRSFGPDEYQDTIILVFVGSSFSIASEFATSAEHAFDTIKKEKVFNYSNEPDRMRYRAFYVNAPSNSFCDFDCNGISRLLCCDISIARESSNLCFPERSTLQTIVIHNDARYGGAGYAADNMAVISKARIGPKLAIHELGHSLFEFGDEYSYGSADDARPNCDKGDCPKWADLNEHPLWKGQLCNPGNCKGRNYNVGSTNSFMKNMMMSIGIVNERFTCCTYLALTKVTPKYCDKFESVGVGLTKYCKDNDYQGYYGRRRLQLVGEGEYASDSFHQRHRHLTVEKPVVLDIGLMSKRVETRSSKPSTSTIFRRHCVQGEYEDFQAAKRDGHDLVHNVTIIFESGDSQHFVFGSKTDIMVPPFDPFDETIKPEYSEPKARHDRENVRIVVDESLGSIVHVGIENVVEKNPSLA